MSEAPDTLATATAEANAAIAALATGSGGTPATSVATLPNAFISIPIGNGAKLTFTKSQAALGAIAVGALLFAVLYRRD